MGLENLTPEEAQELARLMDKVEGTSNPEDDAREQKREWGKPPKPNPATVQRLLPPTEWVEKQLSTLSAVGRENYLRGCRFPRKDPIKEGASDAAQKKYEAKMKDPKILKLRQQKLKKRTIEDWISMVEELGADKLVDGVVKRRHKIERFVGNWHRLLTEHLKTIDDMPTTTREQREAKMIANKRGLEELKGKA